MRTITVPKSDLKILLILAGSIAFICVACWLATTGHVRHVTHGKMLVITYVGIPFFSLCGIAAIVRLLDRRPALVVDDRGITNHASFFAAGAIPWADIDRLEKVIFSGQEMIAVHLKDVDAFTRTLSLPKRLFMRANVKAGYAPISIPKVILPIGIDPILELMSAYLAASRGRG
jgi:hypothetical protein